MTRTIHVPNNIVNRPDPDYVSFTAYQYPNGVQQSKTVIHAACYAEYMKALSDTEFLLMPDTDTARYFLPGDIFLEWVARCQAANIVPDTAMAWIDETDKLPRMKIPKGLPRHIAYTALCVYRFAESYARMPYTFVHASRQWPHLPFWQVLHYAMSRYNCQEGHSWTAVIPGSWASLHSNNGNAWNIMNGVAVPYILTQSPRRLAESQNEYLTSVVTRAAIGLTRKLQVASYSTIPATPIAASADNPEENTILDDVWVPLWKYACKIKCQKSLATVSDEIHEIYTEAVKADPQSLSIYEEGFEKAKKHSAASKTDAKLKW